MIQFVAGVALLAGLALGVKWYIDKRKSKEPGLSDTTTHPEDPVVMPDAAIPSATAPGGVQGVRSPVGGDSVKSGDALFVAPAVPVQASAAEQRALESPERAGLEAAGREAGVIPAQPPISAAEIAASPDMQAIAPHVDAKARVFRPSATVRQLPSLRTIEEGFVKVDDDDYAPPNVGPAALADGFLRIPEPEPVDEQAPAVEDPALAAQLNFK